MHIFELSDRLCNCCKKLTNIQVIKMYASASYGAGNSWMKIMGLGEQGGKKKKDKDKNGITR